jgi:hypothetical protein
MEAHYLNVTKFYLCSCFVVKVQSIGQYDSPAEIFIEACHVLSKKCTALRESLRALQDPTGEPAVGN